ncbi:hypothetical protein ACKWTF_002026 [Chironomus riparius]
MNERSSWSNVRRKEDYSSAKGAKVKYMKDHTDIVVIIFIPHPSIHIWCVDEVICVYHRVLIYCGFILHFVIQIYDIKYCWQQQQQHTCVIFIFIYKIRAKKEEK